MKGRREQEYELYLEYMNALEAAWEVARDAWEATSEAWKARKAWEAAWEASEAWKVAWRDFE